MKTGLWIALTVAVWLLGFLGGYKISAHTGTEPGYFEAVEAAGYGGGAELIEGVSKEMQDYYKGLSEDE
ncbi:hypothetical protein BMS3Abin07_00361 [bacterium BMS3Abin07]|nr:hypothetical protein BMS3Abin07_00361 [bacterium BMS3Abin07]GBE32719.1 hypothetical protein BMS3Bbin05_01637 [bacterium BMS3Bbin05]HDL21285.1 hypothetical protein [Nitrospirota bacterium]HDO21984.1 hypothetical protein [Nitrospirota bacterium]HDZ87718.1 hypothetical protein [Nitrospirota bacterium]